MRFLCCLLDRWLNSIVFLPTPECTLSSSAPAKLFTRSLPLLAAPPVAAPPVAAPPVAAPSVAAPPVLMLHQNAYYFY